MHCIEESLFSAIRNKNLGSVKALIGLLDACHGASFKAVNAQGNTLLHHAIQYKSWDAFELLFDHLENEPEIIFKPNQDGLTLFSFAISRLEYHHAQLIFERLEKKTPLETLIVSFFIRGKGSPFHLEPSLVHPEFFNFLVSKLKDHPGFTFVLNHLDKKGNSVLHRAARAKNIKACALFINAGADFNIKNRAGDQALDSLKESPDLVCEIFKQLKNTKKKAVLEYYRNKILLNGMDNETKNLYLKLASLYSLQEKLRAELEFNQQVPLFIDESSQALFSSKILYSSLTPFLYRLRLLLAEEQLNIARPMDDDLALNNEGQHLLERISFLAMAQASELRTAVQNINPKLRLVSSNHPKITTLLKFSKYLRNNVGLSLLALFMTTLGFSLLETLGFLFLGIALPFIFTPASLLVLADLAVASLFIGVIVLSFTALTGFLLEKAFHFVDQKTHSEKFEGLENDLLALKDTLSALEENNPSLQEAMLEIDAQIKALKDVDICSSEQVINILLEINSCLTSIGEVSLTQLNGINFSMVKGDDPINDSGVDGPMDDAPQAGTQDEHHEAPSPSANVFSFFNKGSKQACHRVELLKDALSLRLQTP